MIHASLKPGYAFERVHGQWEVVILPWQHEGCTSAVRFESIDDSPCVVFTVDGGRSYAQTAAMALDRKVRV